MANWKVLSNNILSKYYLILKAFDYRVYIHTDGDELLTFHRNIMHYIAGWNDKVIDHFVGYDIGPGFLNIPHDNMV